MGTFIKKKRYYFLWSTTRIINWEFIRNSWESIRIGTSLSHAFQPPDSPENLVWRVFVEVESGLHQWVSTLSFPSGSGRTLQTHSQPPTCFPVLIGFMIGCQTRNINRIKHRFKKWISFYFRKSSKFFSIKFKYVNQPLFFWAFPSPLPDRFAGLRRRRRPKTEDLEVRNNTPDHKMVLYTYVDDGFPV